MGREATLRQAGLIKSRYSRWIICNKIDLSYEVSKDVAGVKVVEKITNIRYVPFLTLGELQRNRLSSKMVIPFKTNEEAAEYLKEVINTASSEQEVSLYSMNTVLLQVRNLPTERKLYSNEWAKNQVLTEVAVDLKKLKSSRLL